MEGKRKTVRIPLYYQDLQISILEKLDNPKYAAYVTFGDDKINVFLTPRVDASIIAHEAVHIANHVFRQACITLDIWNDEPYAYLIGWIVKTITRFVEQTRDSLV